MFLEKTLKFLHDMRLYVWNKNVKHLGCKKGF